MPKLFIKTYGCQMNERDSEQVAKMFVQGGYTITTTAEEADAILINSCAVRDQAEQKAIGKMTVLFKRQALLPHVVFGMMGCMAQSKKDELFASIPHLDLVIGTQKYHHAFRYVDSILQTRIQKRMDNPAHALRGNTVCDVAEEADSQNTICDHLNPGARATAFVSIMQGCEMMCSYCIVPYTRGAERSRPPQEILQEVQMLAEAGVKEVTLLGQIVNRYGREWGYKDGKSAFVQLLELVHAVDGIQRIRFVSPHPIGFRTDLVHAFTYLPKLCSHIHFPMQSGSDRILQEMKRPYKNETFIELCEQMRAARPDLSITTDVIVGFPGETEDDFLQTVQACEQIQFDNAFIFRYSQRTGTPAALMPHQHTEAEKESRNQRLLQVINRIAIARNQALVGTMQEILVEGPSRTNAARLCGRTSQNKPVILSADSSAQIGDIITTYISETTGFTLYCA